MGVVFAMALGAALYALLTFVFKIDDGRSVLSASLAADRTSVSTRP
jgi:hypothetical protein